MKLRQSLKYAKQKQLVVVMGIAALILFSYAEGYAQISAYTYQNLSFGAFSTGNSGGTVAIAPNGTRTVTGDVIAVNLGFQYFPAIFEVEAPEGTIVSIVNGANVQLSGSNGGSMTLQIGSSNPTSPFISNVSPPHRTSITVGATLTVGAPASNPPGNYSGSFSVTFVQE